MDRETYDRGAFGRLQFERCQRGFLISASRGEGLMGALYAFDRIEDVGEWLVAEYGEPVKANDTIPQTGTGA